jgi:hypothetical protein
VINTQCFNCKHYRGIFRCDAYPDRDIPDAIFTGEHDHTKPFEGDQGIRFSRRPLLEGEDADIGSG